MKAPNSIKVWGFISKTTDKYLYNIMTEYFLRLLYFLEYLEYLEFFLQD